jgi:penicillin-binding protein 1C
MHEEVAIDTRNGLRATPSCDPKFVVKKEMLSLPDEYSAWASGAGVALSPNAVSPLCGNSGGSVISSRAPKISYPIDGSRFAIEKGRSRQSQMLPITVESDGATHVLVDGQTQSQTGSRVFWTLAPGDHEIIAVTENGTKSAPIRVRVD